MFIITKIQFILKIKPLKMGSICTGEQARRQSNIAGSKILNPVDVKNKPYTSYAFQVVQPQLHRHVQSTLNDPKFRSNKHVDLQGKPFFYIQSKKAYYQGEFNSNRLPEGYGIAIFQDGTYYQGEFKDGQAYDDDATIIFPNGAYYKGPIKNSTMNGVGTLTHKNVYSYEGQWENGYPNGNGVQKYYKQNTNFQGEFNKGFKTGQGQYIWDNGSSKYMGQFHNGLMHDKAGRIESKQGIKYNGQFRLGKREGQGTIETQDGVLEGNFKNDQINGPGKFKWKDGKIYQGDFKKSQFDGKGKIIYPNGKIAQGQWSKNHNKFLSGIKA